MELGEVFSPFCQGFPEWEGTDGFLLPPPGAPSHRDSESTTGRGEAEIMAPSFFSAPGVYGKVGLFSWHEKEVLFFFFLLFGIVNLVELCGSKLKLGLVNALAVEWVVKFSCRVFQKYDLMHFIMGMYCLRKFLFFHFLLSWPDTYPTEE